jgi:hypothetical protein
VLRDALLLLIYSLRAVPGRVKDGNIGTNFRRIRRIFPPKFTWMGAYPGSTDPRGRPTPRWAPWPPPSRGVLTGGSFPYPFGVCHLCTSVCLPFGPSL